jgi:Fic-DOC domain mobile mystery protein B
LSDSFIGDADDAATPLSPEEREGLIPTHIAIRGELNAMEQAGNADADRWVFSRKRDVLDEDFLRRLHRRMFGEVWTWAGQFRVTDKNIGDVPAWRVPADLRQLLGDVRAQIEHKAYPPDEIALRFHNRLTWIHPFPNGNGRLARLAADLLAVQLGERRFTWGRGNLGPASDLRRRYIEAQQSADDRVVGPLLEFARS